VSQLDKGKSAAAVAAPDAHVPSADSENRLWGIMAEFEEHDQLLKATRRAYAEGYRQMDAYAPFPVEGLAEALGREYTSIPLLTLIGGITGGLGAYFMEWYSMSRLYPINVGGRPHNSWPNFIPITFELTVLMAALAAFFGMLILNRLPQLHHPVFNVPEFRRASIDRFFLSIEVNDPKFDLKGTWRFLESLKPLKISEVEDE
jgi:Alternative complex III, ActD subunit